MKEIIYRDIHIHKCLICNRDNGTIKLCKTNLVFEKYFDLFEWYKSPSSLRMAVSSIAVLGVVSQNQPFRNLTYS